MEKGLPLQYREAAEELRSLFGEVAEKFRHPIIIATKGHPCTGRRLFAFWLAATLRCPLIKEDDIQSSSTEQSSPKFVEETNQISCEGVCRIAVSQLEFGLSVVIDSELCCQSQFDQLKNLANWTKTPLVIFECTQPRDESELWRSLEQLEDVAFATRWWDKPSSLADLRRLLDEFNTHSEIDVADDIPKFAVDITPAEDMKKWISYALQSIVTHVESGHNQAQKKKCDRHMFEFWDVQENNQGSCVECLQHISGPIYRCINCNFVLHKSCTQLPSMMAFSSQEPFPFYLRNAENPECEDRCACCNKILKGCFYGFDSPYYDYYLTYRFDLNCIFLPFKRRVKFHEHQLELCFDLDYLDCDACGFRSEKNIYYTCRQCPFNIDPNCAWLPETAVYERHRHPFKLSLSPRDDDSDQYYCNACEKERDPKHWIYYCADCDFPAHTRCLVPSALPPSEFDNK